MFWGGVETESLEEGEDRIGISWWQFMQNQYTPLRRLWRSNVVVQQGQICFLVGRLIFGVQQWGD
jgi:hypothetical protein